MASDILTHFRRMVAWIRPPVWNHARRPADVEADAQEVGVLSAGHLQGEKEGDVVLDVYSVDLGRKME